MTNAIVATGGGVGTNQFQVRGRAKEPSVRHEQAQRAQAAGCSRTGTSCGRRPGQPATMIRPDYFERRLDQPEPSDQSLAGTIIGWLCAALDHMFAMLRPAGR